ncbi:hypothetical protein GF345_06275 [Candidatus Woesearchaeota archaeon]|nr:hypothetical protein [Candidatus Woesearchaeota archaeon]
MVSIDQTIQDAWNGFEEVFFKHRILHPDKDRAIEGYDAVAQKHLSDDSLDRDIRDSVEALKKAYSADSIRVSISPEDDENKTAQALSYFRESMELIDSQHDIVEAIVREFRGIFFNQFRIDHDLGIEDLKKAEEIYEKHGHMEKMARSSSVKGANYLGRALRKEVTLGKDDFRESEGCFMKAISLSDELLSEGTVNDGLITYKGIDYLSRNIISIKADANHGLGRAHYLRAEADENNSEHHLMRSVEILNESEKLYSEVEGGEGPTAIINLEKAYVLSLLNMKDECRIAMERYNEGVSTGTVQDASKTVLKHEVDHVEQYLDG